GGDDLLLQHGHLVERHLHPEIAAGHHQAVGGLGDLVQVLDGGGALDLGDDRNTPPGGGDHGAHGLHVGTFAHVAGGQEVGALGDGEGDVRAVLLGDLEGEGAVGKVDP